MGVDGSFIFFAVINVLGIFMIIYFVKETKGLSVLEIDELYSENKKIDIKTKVYP